MAVTQIMSRVGTKKWYSLTQVHTGYKINLHPQKNRTALIAAAKEFADATGDLMGFKTTKQPKRFMQDIFTRFVEPILRAKGI